MIEFKKITQDLIREYFKDFESDSDIYMDMSKFSEYRYDEEKVNATLKGYLRIPHAKHSSSQKQDALSEKYALSI